MGKDGMTDALRRPTMPSRRRFLASWVAAGAAFPMLEACSTGKSSSYDDAVADVRRPMAAPGAPDSGRLRELITAARGSDLHYLWSAPDHAHPPGGFDYKAFQSSWTFDLPRHRDALRDLLSGLGDV